MVHAGVHPSWDPLMTVSLAREAEQILRGKKYRKFLRAMYSDKPRRWSPDLTGTKRIRFIINCLTRIRFCHPKGKLDFIQKGPPKKDVKPLMPWFDFPNRASQSVRIVCGHWSSLGLINKPEILMIDTGCVWGRELTAARIDGPIKIVSVNAKKTK